MFIINIKYMSSGYIRIRVYICDIEIILCTTCVDSLFTHVQYTCLNSINVDYLCINVNELSIMNIHYIIYTSIPLYVFIHA